jgi:hypothetical protein
MLWVATVLLFSTVAPDDVVVTEPTVRPTAVMADWAWLLPRPVSSGTTELPLEAA